MTPRLVPAESSAGQCFDGQTSLSGPVMGFQQTISTACCVPPDFPPGKMALLGLSDLAPETCKGLSATPRRVPPAFTRPASVRKRKQAVASIEYQRFNGSATLDLQRGFQQIFRHPTPAGPLQFLQPLQVRVKITLRLAKSASMKSVDRQPVITVWKEEYL